MTEMCRVSSWTSWRYCTTERTNQVMEFLTNWSCWITWKCLVILRFSVAASSVRNPAQIWNDAAAVIESVIVASSVSGPIGSDTNQHVPHSNNSITKQFFLWCLLQENSRFNRLFSSVQTVSKYLCWTIHLNLEHRRVRIPYHHLNATVLIASFQPKSLNDD